MAAQGRRNLCLFQERRSHQPAIWLAQIGANRLLIAQLVEDLCCTNFEKRCGQFRALLAKHLRDRF